MTAAVERALAQVPDGILLSAALAVMDHRERARDPKFYMDLIEAMEPHLQGADSGTTAILLEVDYVRRGQFDALPRLSEAVVWAMRARVGMIVTEMRELQMITPRLPEADVVDGDAA